MKGLIRASYSWPYRASVFREPYRSLLLLLLLLAKAGSSQNPKSRQRVHDKRKEVLSQEENDKAEYNTRLFFPSSANARASPGLQIVGYGTPTAVGCALSGTSLIALEEPYLGSEKNRKQQAFGVAA